MGQKVWRRFLCSLPSLSPFLGSLQGAAAHQLLFGHLHAVLRSVQAMWGELMLQARIAGA